MLKWELPENSTKALSLTRPDRRSAGTILQVWQYGLKGFPRFSEKMAGKDQIRFCDADVQLPVVLDWQVGDSGRRGPVVLPPPDPGKTGPLPPLPSFGAGLGASLPELPPLGFLSCN